MVHYGTTAKKQAGLDEGSCCSGVVFQSSCCSEEGFALVPPQQIFRTLRLDLGRSEGCLGWLWARLEGTGMYCAAELRTCHRALR